MKNNTSLSKHIWKLKDTKEVAANVSQVALNKANAFKNLTKTSVVSEAIHNKHCSTPFSNLNYIRVNFDLLLHNQILSRELKRFITLRCMANYSRQSTEFTIPRIFVLLMYTDYCEGSSNETTPNHYTFIIHYLLSYLFQSKGSGPCQKQHTERF